MNNKIIIKQMIRLSRILKELKETRCKLTSVNQQVSYFIIDGEFSDLLKNKTKDNISNCLYLEKYLRLSVSNACKCLDGFNPDKMEPIDYISSSDVKNKFVDICLGKKIVALINLTTGIISSIEPEQKELAEDKCPSEKS